MKLPNPKYIPKPYEQMTYPGQRGQIDVMLRSDSLMPLSVVSRRTTVLNSQAG